MHLKFYPGENTLVVGFADEDEVPFADDTFVISLDDELMREIALGYFERQTSLSDIEMLRASAKIRRRIESHRVRGLGGH